MKCPADIRQLDNWSCGPCCVQSITGSRPKIGRPITGTTPDAIYLWFYRMGYAVTRGIQWGVEDLKFQVGRDRYVICLTKYDDGAGHWVVVWKVTNRSVHYHCPMKGPQVVSKSDFLSRWESEGFHRVGIAVAG